MYIYVVKEGDTVNDIAQMYGVSTARLLYDNEIFNGQIVPGQALIVLVPAFLYEVNEGDTLYAIANNFGVTVNDILRNNSYLLNESFLLPGRELVIEYEKNDGDLLKNKDIFGYAYPFIREDVLEEACLYINELLPFSYGFNNDGNLIMLNDDNLLQTAKRFENNKRMVLTPLDSNGRFNNMLVAALLSDSTMQENLIENILIAVKNKEYNGVDIDFEFIPGQYRNEYVSFIRSVKERLNEEGLTVNVALPPKISDEQTGLLYEGIDYAGLGKAADTVLLMTYEWGYKYGPPMAVAPIPSVRRVLDYAVSRIEASKIYMGIPNYAYDWPLPYEKGVTVAETIGNTEAVRRAFTYGTNIIYDENAKSPYYNYIVNGVEHVVWFEDVRSIEEKYILIKEYGFRGAGYWNLMREFRQNWLFVNQIL
ncbi:MAG: LysM peptidoglycan-binding domain-containing protein [Lachnospiraceae bacterium]|nr:LysM peptidoglycan-binding domain-containing protein [Lachnospiraceae bacterium]